VPAASYSLPLILVLSGVPAWRPLPPSFFFPCAPACICNTPSFHEVSSPLYLSPFCPFYLPRSPAFLVVVAPAPRRGGDRFPSAIGPAEYTHRTALHRVAPRPAVPGPHGPSPIHISPAPL